MANRRKRSNRNTKKRNRAGGNMPNLSKLDESSSDKSAPSSPSTSSHRKKRHSLFSSQKFLWWTSLAILIASILVGLGRSIIRQQQQERLEQNENLKPTKQSVLLDANDAVRMKARESGTKTSRNPAMRLLKRVKTGLVEGLRASSPISGQFARGNIDTNQVDVSVESTDTSRHDRSISKQKDHSGEYPSGFTVEPHLTVQKRSLLQQLSLDVKKEWPDLKQRATAVAWGGPVFGSHWWNPSIANPHHLKHAGLEQIDGSNLLYSYLTIMKWPENLRTNFPFGICKGDDNGCPGETAIGHTLEWREKFKPWMATPTVLAENEEGWIYTRGFSPPAASDPAYGRHAVVWIRPGIHSVKNSLAYFRCILHSADRAVALSLQQSGGRVGKFNTVIDGQNYEWSCVPSLKYIKQAVIMLQDHLPDRLGMVFMVNISLAGEILFTLIKPLLTKDVRDKIKILSSDPAKRMAELEKLVEKEYIPTFLGGTDTYQFDAASYFPKSMQWSEEQGREFMKSMPYHATSN